MSKQTITDQVRTYLEAGEHGDDYDIDGIVEEIGDRHGYDVASIDEIDGAEWNEILQRHDTSV